MATTVAAREVLQGTACSIPADQTIEGTLFTLCETLDLQGTVNGNVIGIALRAKLNGEVAGNVYLAGGELTQGGRIDGALHYVGVAYTLMEGGSVGGGALFGTLKSALLPTSSVGGNIVSLGYELYIMGDVAQEVNFWGASLSVGGQMGGNVYASVGDPESDASQIRGLLLPFGFDVTLNRPGLTLLEGGRVGGDIVYYGVTEAVLDGTLEGTADFTRLTAPLPTLDRPATLTVFWNQAFSEFTALVAVGFLGWLVAPQWLNRPLARFRLRSVSAFSVGLLAFLLSFPIVLIIAFSSVVAVFVLLAVRLEGVAVAVGILLLVVNGAGIGAFYFLAIYVGRVLVAWTLGRFLLRPLQSELAPRAFAFASLLLGTGLLGLGVALPLVGWMVNALALFLGLGTLLTVALREVDRARNAPAPNTATVSAPEPVILATPPPLGMSHLPEGFDIEFFRE
jgi:hypothetical protein